MPGIAGTTPVLRNLPHGLRFFGDLRRELPSRSAKVLAERLDSVRARG